MERFEHGGNVYAHPGCVDFSANLNPLGMPTSAREALRDAVDAFAAYPDPACTELVARIAAFERVPQDWVVPCAGASDAFARICQALRPSRALLCAPCYSGYEQALEQVGSRVTYHDLSAHDDFAVTHDLVRDLEAGIDLLFLANPNNPTGRCVEPDVLESCVANARATSTVVVLDECFIDLVTHDGSGWSPGSNVLLSQNPNLVLVKALTKSFCLAGLRIGYALCSDVRLATRLRDAGQPWAVSTPAQVAAVACLADEGADYLDKSRELIARERMRLEGALRSKELRVVPSEANYLLFYGPLGLAESLLDHGILIRSCDNYRGLDGRWYRIAVRTPRENDMLVEALNRLFGPKGVLPFGS